MWLSLPAVLPFFSIVLSLGQCENQYGALHQQPRHAYHAEENGLSRGWLASSKLYHIFSD